jgi:DNA-directed RNA polymerase subunit M/transcription elongation factor TFIIS
MEMDCWQYWDAVKKSVKQGKTKMRCFKCGYEIDPKKRLRSGNVFAPCPKCKSKEVRFYIKRKKNE